MSSRWAKLFHCKSNAADDVVNIPNSTPETTKHPQSRSQSRPNTSTSINPKQFPKQRPKPNIKTTPCLSHPPPPPPLLPTLLELPAAHSSRRVVEMIFRSSWCPSGGGAPFHGHIQRLFRVHHSPLVLAAFENRRAAIRLYAGDARCAADGNEMMRFHSAAASGEVYRGGVARSTKGKLEGVRTFAGSGGAHEIACGGAGRRGVLLCRVIVGRVGVPEEANLGVDSVRLGKDEILVFDARAVLPCFLIIYEV